MNKPFRILNIANKHKLPTIIFMAALTTLILMLLVRIDSGHAFESFTVYERDGLYDLSSLDMNGESVAVLQPGTSYYPNTYLMAGDTAGQSVSADRYNELKPDYLSQRFVIDLPDSGTVYKLTFNASGSHAFRVYVNGELVGQTGHAGTTKQETRVWENNIVCYATPSNNSMEVILHSAQFYRYGRGAGLAMLTIGKAPLEPAAVFTSIDKGLVTIGVLLCASVILFFAYVMRRSVLATPYFALACIAMALRENIKSQAWTVFPFITGNTAFMLEYMSLVLLTIFLTLYLAQTLKNRIGRIVKRIVLGGSFIYGGCLLFTDSLFYTWALTYYQILLVGCIVCGISALFWMLRQPDSEQSVMLYGIAVFYLAAVSDILMYNGLFGSSISRVSVSETAMLVFVLAQMVSLFLLNNRLIAEAKESERKIAVEKTALESLNNMKTEFLQNVSHELKTPITVMANYARDTLRELGKTPNDIPEMEFNQSRIVSEAERLGRMVNQLLNVTSIEGGRFRIQKESFSLAALIRRTADANFNILSDSGNKLRLEIDEGLSEVFADSHAIGQVLLNLLSNAIRHTKLGTITISLSAAEGYQKIQVTDDGSGMPIEALEQVFVRYVERESRMNGNSGLGLYICKKLIDAHGGDIGIESELGIGTSVWFSLPENGGQMI